MRVGICLFALFVALAASRATTGNVVPSASVVSSALREDATGLDVLTEFNKAMNKKGVGALALADFADDFAAVKAKIQTSVVDKVTRKLSRKQGATNTFLPAPATLTPRDLVAVQSRKSALQIVIEKGDENGKSFRPTDDDYIASTVRVAIAGLFFAIVSFFFLAFFCCFRCCCNTCGKRKPTRVYQAKNRRVTYVGTAITGIICLIGAIVAWNGNALISDGIYESVDQIFVSFDAIEEKLQKIDSFLVILEQDPATETNAFESEKADVEDVRSDVRDVNERRESGTGGIVAIIVVGYFVILVACLVRVGALGWFGLFLFWIGLTLTWLLFAIHIPVQKVFDDICDDTRIFLDNPKTTTWLDLDGTQILSCPAASVTDDSRDALGTALEGISRNATLAGTWPPGNPELRRSDWLTYPTSEATIAALAKVTSEAVEPDLKKKLQAGLDAIDVIEFVDSCRIITDIINNVIFKPLCGTLGRGLERINVGLALEGVFCLIGLFFVIPGLKQYSKQVVGPAGYPVIKNDQGVNVEMVPLVAMPAAMPLYPLPPPGPLVTPGGPPPPSAGGDLKPKAYNDPQPSSSTEKKPPAVPPKSDDKKSDEKNKEDEKKPSTLPPLK